MQVTHPIYEDNGVPSTTQVHLVAWQRLAVRLCGQSCVSPATSSGRDVKSVQCPGLQSLASMHTGKGSLWGGT